MLTYHFISPSNPCQPQEYVIRAAKIQQKTDIESKTAQKTFAVTFFLLLLQHNIPNNKSFMNRQYLIASALTAILMYTSEVSAQDSWIDITDDFVVNPRFDGNDISTGWLGTAFGSANPKENAEHYQKNFNTYQVITGVVPGKYRVSVNAFYRCGNADNDYNTYTAGDRKSVV